MRSAPTRSWWSRRRGAKRHRSPVEARREDVADDMLLAGLGVGDPVAARAFITRFDHTVFGVALAVCGDPEMAEDIAQQAFEHAWRHAKTYDARRGSVGAWLRGITHNLAVDAVRIRRQVPVTDHDLQVLLGAAADDPEARAVAADAGGDLRRALESLAPEQARTVVLAALYGMSAAQIAESESIPLGTAKTRLRAGLTKLHRSILRRGGCYE